MSLDPGRFTVHDIREFPFVVFDPAQAGPGYAGRWEAEMAALVENGEPFVVVYDELRAGESHEDRRQRGIWLKRNKTALGRVCKALISIEPDEARRREVEAMSQIAVRAFGIPHAVVATWKEALDAARRAVARSE